MKLRKKLYPVSPEIDVPDGISFFVTPMQIVTGGGRTIPNAKFMRYVGMEEVLGNSTFVFHAPDNMQDSLFPPNAAF